jgi:hypothetical protein
MVQLWKDGAEVVLAKRVDRSSETRAQQGHLPNRTGRRRQGFFFFLQLMLLNQYFLYFVFPFPTPSSFFLLSFIFINICILKILTK